MINVLQIPFLFRERVIKKQSLSPDLVKLIKAKKYTELPIFRFSKVLETDFPSGKAKGLIFGNFGAFNYGDEALLAGQIKELRSIRKHPISVVARFPHMVKKMHKVPAISMFDFRQIVKAVYTSDFVMVGGGGLFCKNDGGFIGLSFQIYILLLFLFLPMLLGKKVYAVGIGFYKNTNPAIAFFARLLLQKAAVVTVRDTYSYLYLLTYGNRAVLYKDSSYLMDMVSKKNIEREKIFKNKLVKKKYHVGIAVKKPATDHETKKITTELTKFIKKNKADTVFWFFPNDNHAGYTDVQFSKDIIAKVGENVKAYLIPEHWHPDQFFSSFKLMNYFIAMRFHSLVFSHRNEIPFYGMTYDEKCSSFLESIGRKPIYASQSSSLQMQKGFNKVKKNI